MGAIVAQLSGLNWEMPTGVFGEGTPIERVEIAKDRGLILAVKRASGGTLVVKGRYAPRAVKGGHWQLDFTVDRLAFDPATSKATGAIEAGGTRWSIGATKKLGLVFQCVDGRDAVQACLHEGTPDAPKVICSDLFGPGKCTPAASVPGHLINPPPFPMGRTATPSGPLHSAGIDGVPNADPRAKSAGQTVTVEGVARTAKMGPMVKTDKGTMWVELPRGWPPGAEGKKVRVTGTLTQRSDLPVFVAKPGEPARAGMPVPAGTDLAEAAKRGVLTDVTVTVIE
jgi:hypothetical protein